MGAYLEDNPPARSQYRCPRRATVTGAIVVHTAENSADRWPPDGGAEGVARFISERTDGPGSYHELADSDSAIQVVPYSCEAFGEGTGGNRWALHLSFACKAAQWPSPNSKDGEVSQEWTTAAIRNGAKAAARMAAWAHQVADVTVPAARITPSQYRSKAPGFIGHGELDPGRRTDPGTHFPWKPFLAEFNAQMANTLTPSTAQQSEWEATPKLVDVHGEISRLYWAHRDGSSNSYDPEVRAWLADIAARVYRGESPVPALRYIEYTLRNERKS